MKNHRNTKGQGRSGACALLSGLILLGCSATDFDLKMKEPRIGNPKALPLVVESGPTNGISSPVVPAVSKRLD